MLELEQESIRTPTVIRYPREIAPGTRLGAGSGIMVTNMDWAPSLLDYATVIDGGAIPHVTGGQSKGSGHETRGQQPQQQGRSFRWHVASPTLAMSSTSVSSSLSALAKVTPAREALYYRYYGDEKAPLTRPGHLGIRTRGAGQWGDGMGGAFKLILYYGLRCHPDRWGGSSVGPWEVR